LRGAEFVEAAPRPRLDLARKSEMRRLRADDGEQRIEATADRPPGALPPSPHGTATRIIAPDRANRPRYAWPDTSAATQVRDQQNHCRRASPKRFMKRAEAGPPRIRAGLPQPEMRMTHESRIELSQQFGRKPIFSKIRRGGRKLLDKDGAGWQPGCE